MDRKTAIILKSWLFIAKGVSLKIDFKATAKLLASSETNRTSAQGKRKTEKGNCVNLKEGSLKGGERELRCIY